jgi:hypothetical protein
MDTTAHYLNVDLDIRSKTDLGPVLKEMGRRVAVMHSGPVGAGHLLAVETARVYKNPDATVHALCEIVENLSPASRRLWNGAEKHFDIGYELPPELAASRFSLRADTLLRVARLGAALAVTHYVRNGAESAPRGESKGKNGAPRRGSVSARAAG